MKIAIVLPRHVLGAGISAGAERLGGALAHQLAVRGHTVEILTTTALDWRAPARALPAGVTCEQAGEGRLVTVRRFAIDWALWNRASFEAATHQWMRAVDRPSEADEAMLIEAMPHAPGLYDFLDRHQRDYEALLFLPYLAATTLCGASVCAERAAIMPCLHDEPLARMGIVRALLQAARSVLFLTEAERALAERDMGIRLRRAHVTGAGVTDRSAEADGERFRRRLGVRGPIVLYSGRIEAAKNIYALLACMGDFMRRYPQHRDVTLALRGTELSVVTPRRWARVVPAQSETEYRDAYAAAAAHVNPSLVESFSVSLMEGWLAGKPALAHARCDVTREHVQASNGGLWFGDSDEFGATLDWLLTHPAESRRMGALGRQYVLDNYNWPRVIARVEQALA